MKVGEFKIDAEKLEQGGWVDEIPEFQGVRLKVRGTHNAAWKRLERKLIDAVPRKKRVNGRVEQDEQDRIISTCLHQCCLDDWSGIMDDDDNPIQYSKEQARAMLFEPEYRRFRDAVIWAATFVVEQEKLDQEEITKN